MVGIRPWFCTLMSPLSLGRKHLEAFRRCFLSFILSTFWSDLLHYLIFQTLPAIPPSVSHLLTLPCSHVNMPLIGISVSAWPVCVRPDSVVKSDKAKWMIPSSKQSGAGGRAEGRKPAMGIWIIHSVHFINIIMEETERAGSEREGWMEEWKTDLW